MELSKFLDLLEKRNKSSEDERAIREEIARVGSEMRKNGIHIITDNF